jgi:hypothetical protein
VQRPTKKRDEAHSAPVGTGVPRTLWIVGSPAAPSSTTTACPVEKKNPAGQQKTIASSSNDSHIDSGDGDKTDNPESRDNVIVTAAARRRFQDHEERLDPSVVVTVGKKICSATRRAR